MLTNISHLWRFRKLFIAASREIRLEASLSGSDNRVPRLQTAPRCSLAHQVDVRKGDFRCLGHTRSLASTHLVFSLEESQLRSVMQAAPTSTSGFSPRQPAAALSLLLRPSTM